MPPPKAISQGSNGAGGGAFRAFTGRSAAQADPAIIVSAVANKATFFMTIPFRPRYPKDIFLMFCNVNCGTFGREAEIQSRCFLFGRTGNLKKLCVFLTSIMIPSTMIAGAVRTTKDRWDRTLSLEQRGAGLRRGARPRGDP